MNFFRTKWQYLARFLMCTLLIYCSSLASSGDATKEDNFSKDYIEKMSKSDTDKANTSEEVTFSEAYSDIVEKYSTLIFAYDLYWWPRQLIAIVWLFYFCFNTLFIIHFGSNESVWSSKLWTAIVLGFFGLYLIMYIASRLDRLKMYIICQPTKITLNHKVIPTKNIKLAKVNLNFYSNITKVQLYSKNNHIMYTLEAKRMKELSSVLALISFLRENNVLVKYE